MSQAHVSFTLARASPELDLLNLCRVLQNAAGSGEVVNHGVEKKYLQQRRRGAASAATAVAASRVTASATSARTCNERTASLSGLPVEDRALQSGYRHCDPKTNCHMYHIMVVQTPDWSMLRCAPCLCRCTATISPSAEVPAPTRCSPSSHFFIVIWFHNFHLIFSAKFRGERKSLIKKLVPTF